MTIPQTRLLNYSCLALVTLKACFLFTTPLRFHGDLMACAQDDFYYYLVIARNLAAGLGSTFDGSTLTNGYHPLYELVLWGFAAVAHTLTGIFRLLALLDILSALVIFIAVRRLFQRHIHSAWLSNGLALIVLFLCCFKIFQQMEVTLALPFAFILLAQLDQAPKSISPARWFFVGLTSAAATLSRLDTGLLVALCCFGVLIDPIFRSSLSPRKVACFLFGAVPPLAVYFAINLHLFHLLMPISGTAKQLKTTHEFTWNALSKSLSPEATVMFAAAMASLFMLAFLWRRLPPQTRVICSSALLFPFVHWMTFLWVSDWRLWGWYNYSLRPAMAVFLLLLAVATVSWSRTRAFQFASILTFACAAAIFIRSAYKVDRVMIDIASTARALGTFSINHPGVYAMGDRGGMVGYTLRQPLLQTEGLVMDQAYVDHIRRRDPLLPVLHQYNVRYYIAFDEGQTKSFADRHSCLDVREPAQAGPTSPVMMARLCQPPVWEDASAFGDTMIFDLQPGTAQAPINSKQVPANPSPSQNRASQSTPPPSHSLELHD